MNAKIQIRDAQSNQVLQEMGTLTYGNTGIAIQDCERWYRDEIEAYEERGYCPEIVLVDIPSPVQEMGRKGGSSTSPAKKAASQENGRKGGRPRKK